MNSGNIPPIPVNIIRAVLFSLAVILWASSAAAEPGLLFPERLPKIVIDPGHGGADTGAQGPTGHLEKTITLELARQLSQILETQYQIILTRNDDYSVAPRQRTAIANQVKADLFIALHTGAGFLHGTNLRTVYYYNPLKRDGNITSDAGAKDGHQRWELAQKPYKEQSLSLATALIGNLEKLGDGTESKIQGAPVVVLEGAAMPAALVEVGHVTHPATEKKLLSAQGIEVLARAIGQGVNEYFKTSAASRLSSSTHRSDER